MPGIRVEKLTASKVISRFMRRATSVKRSIWKPSTPPPSFGMACGAKVPSTPGRSGGRLDWASAAPETSSAAKRIDARRNIGSLLNLVSPDSPIKACETVVWEHGRAHPGHQSELHRGRD